MPEFNATTVYEDPNYGAAEAAAAWPRQWRMKDWRAAWAPYINHMLENGGVALLPLRLMGECEVFRDTQPEPSNYRARDAYSFIIGGEGSAYLYVGRSVGGVLRKARIEGTILSPGSWDSWTIDDARVTADNGWILVQLTSMRMPRVAVGFSFFNNRGKPLARQQAELFVRALNPEA